MFVSLSTQFILVSCCIALGLTESYFPQDVKICSAKDPSLNECVKESANKMVKYLAPGIRNLNAIPMEPLVVHEMAIGRHNNLLPSLEFSAKDLHFAGWTEGYFTNTKIDPVKREFSMTMLFPLVHQWGNYEMNGSIASIPLKGNSNFDLYYKNMTFSVDVKSHLKPRNGQNYLAIERFDRNIHVDDIFIDIRKLFNDDNISNVTNNLLNQNTRAVLDELNPVLESLLGDTAQLLLQRIFDRVPYDTFFADFDQ